MDEARNQISDQVRNPIRDELLDYKKYTEKEKK